MKLLDYAALLTALFLTVFSFISALDRQSESLEILIQANDKEWIYPIDSTLDQKFSGPVGQTTIHIEDGKVSAVQSDCSEQICVQSGTIENAGQWIACMPNRIFVTVRGKKEEGLDGEAY